MIYFMLACSDRYYFSLHAIAKLKILILQVINVISDRRDILSLFSEILDILELLLSITLFIDDTLLDNALLFHKSVF